MGSVFLTAVVFVVLFALAIFMTPWALIPAIMLGVFFLATGAFAGAAKSTGGERAGTGTPSTSEASYDPTSTPGQRTV